MPAYNTRRQGRHNYAEGNRHNPYQISVNRAAYVQWSYQMVSLSNNSFL